MSTTADLGWCIARCRIATGESAPDVEHELVICSPASEAEPAASISILGLASILALRDCIDEEVARAEQTIEMARKVIASDD